MQGDKKFWADEIVRLYFEGHNLNEALRIIKEMIMDYEFLIKRGV